MRRWLICLALMLVPGLAAADTGRDAGELRRTWEAAVVYVPDGAGGADRLSVADLPGWLAGQQSVRLVLYAHGCLGPTVIDHGAGAYYARRGYVFVAPDGFARRDKPASCSLVRRQGGLHRAVLGWRQAEIDHALRHLRRMPGMARAPVALIGHSEGAITVATVRTLPVDARVIEAWTCHGGWPEYVGINAPSREPVLSFVGRNDRWLKHPSLRGDCGEFMDSNDRSVVFEPPDRLHNDHWLAKDKRVRDAIVTFLARHLSE